jgi:hypothetical protein
VSFTSFAAAFAAELLLLLLLLLLLMLLVFPPLLSASRYQKCADISGSCTTEVFDVGRIPSALLVTSGRRYRLASEWPCGLVLSILDQVG